MRTILEVTVEVYAYLIVQDGEDIEDWKNAAAREQIRDEVRRALTRHEGPMVMGRTQTAPPGSFLWDGCDVIIVDPTPIDDDPVMFDNRHGE